MRVARRRRASSWRPPAAAGRRRSPRLATTFIAFRSTTATGWPPAGRSRCRSGCAAPRSAADEPPALLVLEAEVARRPRVDHGQAEVRDPAPAHGRLPARVGAHRGLALDELVEHDGRLDAGHVLPGDAPAPGSARRSPRRSCPPRCPSARRRPTRSTASPAPVPQDGVLRRLMQGDGDDPDSVARLRRRVRRISHARSISSAASGSRGWGRPAFPINVGIDDTEK